jgi:uncharacterized 2Fe-2S/4Fe-4S cluster protein (DUF4445 family)
MTLATVSFSPGGKEASVEAGVTLASAAALAGVPLRTPCGGQGRCGKCLVQARGKLSEPTAAERRVLSEQELSEGWRLACQAVVVGDAQVSVPASSLVIEHRIVAEGVGRETVVEPSVQKAALRLPLPSPDDARSDLTRVMDALGGRVAPPSRAAALRHLPHAVRAQHGQVTAVVIGGELVDVEAGDTSEACYGVAVDVGTTTVVLYLCRLGTGQVAGVASGVNPQAQHGDDVISRLQFAVSTEDGTRRLQREVVGLINDLVATVCQQAGVSRHAIYEMVAVGNTCMAHFLLGVPPLGLAGKPFAPGFKSGQDVGAAELGIDINPAGRVYMVPGIGGFVGADTVGVILASELDVSNGLRVAVDIGTNGEIVVARDGDLYACSTAAGPAFEGARISQGMRAASGAIDSVTVDGAVRYHVIGDVPPRGLCGSGVVDAVAELVKAGIVDGSGRFRAPEELDWVEEKVRRRVVRNEGGLEFVLAPAEESGTGRPVVITARDVRQLQLAKGAIYAGISLMLSRLGLEPEGIESLLLAGAFGNYIRRESAVAIGIVPAIDGERIVSIGNAAGVGARLALCSTSLRRRAEEIGRRVEHVDLSQEPGFYDHFAEAMALRPLSRLG